MPRLSPKILLIMCSDTLVFQTPSSLTEVHSFLHRSSKKLHKSLIPKPIKAQSITLKLTEKLNISTKSLKSTCKSSAQTTLKPGSPSFQSWSSVTIRDSTLLWRSHLSFSWWIMNHEISLWLLIEWTFLLGKKNSTPSKKLEWGYCGYELARQKIAARSTCGFTLFNLGDKVWLDC